MSINTNYSNFNLSSLYPSYSSLFNTGKTKSSGNDAMSKLISSLSNSGSGTVDYTALGYVQSLKNGASDLKASISDLSKKSAFTKTAAVSSDTDSMTVKSSESKYYNYASASTASSVKISQLAEGQKNTGTALQADAEVKESDMGTKLVEIESGGKKYQVSFDVKAGDTNEDVQKKMADAINKSNAGIKASVETSKDGKTTALQLESKGTGTGGEGTFKIKDLAGNAVSLTGADKVSQKAQDAVYYLNGSDTAKTSQSNTVDIGGGVTATFKKASDDEISVTRETDADNAVSVLKDFAKSYNSLFSAVRDTADSKGDKLFTQMVNNSIIYAGSLASLGVGFDSNGEMTVDEEKASKAAKDGSLTQFFTENSGKNYGFTNRLSRIADDVSSNTGKYVSSGTAISDVTYSPYQAKSASQYNSLGMFFDMLF